MVDFFNEKTCLAHTFLSNADSSNHIKLRMSGNSIGISTFSKCRTNFPILLRVSFSHSVRCCLEEAITLIMCLLREGGGDPGKNLECRNL